MLYAIYLYIYIYLYISIYLYIYYIYICKHYALGVCIRICLRACSCARALIYFSNALKK